MLELRVAALLVYAAYLFSLDDYVLSKLNINILRVFGYQQASSTPRNVASNLLMVLLSGCAVVSTQRAILPGVQTRVFTLVTLICTIVLILKQQRLRRVLSRVIRGRVSSDHRLGDILVSDALVSLAPVLSDITLSVYLSIYSIPVGESLDRAAMFTPLIPLTASIPSVIRMKQCFGEYRSTKNKQHILNFFKYFVGNLPNAIRTQLSVLSRFEGTEDTIKQYEQRLFYVLILSATYSFTWDILVDWKLNRLSNKFAVLRLPRWSYFMAFIVDFALRYAFLFAVPYEHVIFGLQALELTRRGMWIIFRVDSEPDELEEIELHQIK